MPLTPMKESLTWKEIVLILEKSTKNPFVCTSYVQKLCLFLQRLWWWWAERFLPVSGGMQAYWNLIPWCTMHSCLYFICSNPWNMCLGSEMTNQALLSFMNPLCISMEMLHKSDICPVSPKLKYNTDYHAYTSDFAKQCRHCQTCLLNCGP